MIKILVVDDDEVIRKGLITILTRSGIGAQVYECENGEAAFAFLMEQRVDIVIADIKMPKMSGLVFVRKMHQYFANPPRVIILSGYDDFGFAAEAIKLRVSAYLLKPVDMDELVETVQDVLQQAKKQQKATLYDICAMRLQEAILGREAEDPQFCRQYAFLEETYQIRLFAQSGASQTALARFKQYFSTTARYFLMQIENRPVAVFSKSAVRNNDQDENPPLFICAQSSWHKGIKGLPEAYEEALFAEKYYLLLRGNSVRYEQVEKRKKTALPVDLVTQLRAFKGYGTQQISRLLDLIFSQRAIETYDLDYFLDAEKMICRELLSKYEVFLAGDDRFRQLCMLDLGLAEYKNQLRDFLLQIKARLEEYQNHPQQSLNKSHALERAVLFIDENFEKNINMAVVANHVSLNYSYFSSSFKQYKGKSFVEYLKEIRIEHARKFLAGSQKKISDIAKQCGYEDAKQFSKAFKEVSGISPKDYRAMMRYEYLEL